MEQRLKAGGTVWIKLPYGDFVIDNTTDAVLIAGGTGISAFTAFIEALPATNQHQVMLVYGARTPSLFLFQDMIRAQQSRVANFGVLLFAEEAAVPPCHPGRISLETVWLRLDATAPKVFYLSGPPAMLSALTDGLQVRGIAPEWIRTDAWE
jgi:ferredoxin-NADP reductase